MDRTDLYAFMSRQKYGVVSSISPTGVPQSALVGIAVTQKLEIVFDTLNSTRKYPNLVARPDCSFVLGWAGEQTVQCEGVASEPEGLELARYREIYFEVWPECREHLAWPGIVHLVVQPRWIRYSDFDQRPPLVLEFTLPDPGFPS